MNSLLSILSALGGGLGLLLSSPIGPATMPAADMQELRLRAQPAFIARMRDAEGVELGQYTRDRPLATPLDRLPPTFLQAVIAIEDRRFFDHRGIDPIGLAGAFLSQFGRNPRGGSTIDQQMAKNAWTGPEVSLRRKIPEAVLALRARQALGASGVLQAYLETAWFGRGVTGAAGAAHAWFGRDWDTLDLAEIAYMAGLLAGPAFFDAQRHPERAVNRRNQVIAAMLREGFISPEEADAARAGELQVAPRQARHAGPGARWAMSTARREIARSLDGLIQEDRLLSDVDVTLTLSGPWQTLAQNALRDAVSAISTTEPLAQLPLAIVEEALEAGADADHLGRLARDHLTGLLPWDSEATPALLIAPDGAAWRVLSGDGTVQTARVERSDTLRPAAGDVLALTISDETITARGRTVIDGAVVILDPRNGAILASVGGAEPGLTEFDRTRALRQPGSAIKTMLWLAALEAGYQLGTPVPDLEQDYITEDGTPWRPRNYGRTQAGMVAFSTAFEQSSNLVAAALINALGVETMARMAERAGAYPEGMPRHMTAALGTMEVTLLDLTRAHAAIVNDGVPRAPRSIGTMQINGRQVIEGGIPVGTGVMGSGPIAGRAAIEDMLTMMHGVVQRGTASRAFQGHPVTLAGKTGTTQGYRDAWFVGVTPHLAIGIWLGRDDNAPMSGRPAGGRTAAPIAARILREAHAQGLIDAMGYRDDQRASGISWPPGPAGQGFGPARREPDQVIAPTQAPDIDRATGAPGMNVADPFWGVVDHQPAQPQPPTEDRFRPANRNEDLRRNRWD